MLFGQLQVDSNSLLKEEADKADIVIKDANDQPLVDILPRLENINRLSTIPRLNKIKVIAILVGIVSIFVPGERKRPTCRLPTKRQQEGGRKKHEFLRRRTLQLFQRPKLMSTGLSTNLFIGYCDGFHK
jgi:hypothetical protein